MADSNRSPRVKIVKSTNDYDSLKKALAGQDAVVSLLGTMNTNAQRDFVNAAADAGVKWFLPSEFGGNTDNEELVKVTPFNESKVAVWKMLQEKESTGMSWTSFVTGPLFDFCMPIGFLGIDIGKREATYLDKGEVVFSSSVREDVGAAVANLLASPENLEKYRNKHVAIDTFNVSQKEIVTALEKITGETFKTSGFDSKQAHKEALEKYQKGDFSGLRDVILYPILGPLALGDHEKNPGVENETLLKGAPHPTLEEALKAVVKEMGV